MAKKQPTKAERDHMTKVAAMGCLICSRPAEVHHVRKGNHRRDHMRVIPLCPWHHRHGPTGEAVHSGFRSFEMRHGDQFDMLRKVDAMLKAGESFIL